MDLLHNRKNATIVRVVAILAAAILAALRDKIKQISYPRRDGPFSSNGFPLVFRWFSVFPSLRTMFETVSDALAFPKDYPSLFDSVFPGDRIVIVPDIFAASRPELLAETASLVLKAGIEPDHVLVLLTEADERDHGPTLRSLLEQADPGLRIHVHKPGLRQELAMLGTNARNEPIAVNREIVDADVVIAVQKDGTGESAVFPRFSDSETIQRFHEAANREKSAAKALRKTLRLEATEVSGLLGIAVTLKCVTKGRKGLAFEASHGG